MPIDEQTKQNIFQQGKAFMAGIGVFSAPSPDRQSIGYTNSGKEQFASAELLNSPDHTLGSQVVGTLKGTLDPLGVFSKEDATNLEKIATVSSDINFFNELSAYQQRGDKKGFATALLNRVGQPLINNLDISAENKQGLGTAFSAYKLFSNWDKLSTAQKGMGVAGIGIKGYKFATGENLQDKVLIDAVGKNPGLTVGQGLGLLQTGYNVYDLKKNWGQLNTIQRITQGTQTAGSIAMTAENLGLLGNGVSGAEVAGLSGKGLQATGWTQAPHLGPGAMVADKGAQLPAGYASVGESGTKVIAAPQGTAAITENSVSQGAPATGTFGQQLGQAAGGLAFASGAQQVAGAWGKGGSEATTQGAIGGLGMAAGLYSMGATNPYLLAGVVAASALGANLESKTSQKAASIGSANNPLNVLSAKDPVKEGGLFLATGGMYQTGRAIKEAFEGGKSGEQQGRDAVRDRFKSIGVVGDDYQVTLADGSKADIGIDGHHQKHAVKNPSRLSSNQKDMTELNAYDTDYTNDLDYVSGLGGISLSRIVSGGKGVNVDQIGGQFGNAALQNVGFGQDMTPENFNKVMDNQRAIYAQSGIKTKADAYQLINQGMADGRWNESEAISMHQAANMIYDKDGYQTAQKLMGGRYQGIEAVTGGDQNVGGVPAEGIKPVTRPTPGKGNKWGSETSLPFSRGQDIDPGFNAGKPTAKSEMAQGFADVFKGLASSKDEARARNSAKFVDYGQAPMEA